MRRRMTLSLWLAGVGAALAQDPAGQFGDWWNQGSLVAGRTYKTELSVINENCKGFHDFEVSLDAEAKKYFILQKDPVVRDLGEGTWGKVLVLIDLRQVPPGGYERGHFLIRCLDCPPSCSQDYRRLRATFAVFASADLPVAPGPHGMPLQEPPQELVTGEPKPKHPSEPGLSEPSPPPGGGTIAVSPPPVEPSAEPVKRCGPDVTSALLDAIRRLRARVARLPAAERAQGGFELWKRNAPWSLRDPEPRSCAARGEPCLGTVTLFGRCTASSVPEWILDGVLRALLDPEEAHRRAGEPLPTDSPDGALARASFALGVAMADALGASAEELSWDELSRRVEQAYNRALARSLDLFAARWIRCDLCGDPARFGDDCTLRDWRLADGGVAKLVE